MSETFEARMAVLRAEYVEQLAGRLHAVDEAWRRWLDGDPASGSEGLRQEAHALAGSGLTFGFPALSYSGRALERLLASPAVPTGEALDAVERAIEAVRRAVEAAQRTQAQRGG